MKTLIKVALPLLGRIGGCSSRYRPEWSRLRCWDGTGAVMRVGVLDLISDCAPTDWANRLYGRYLRKQFMSIMPQAVSVWCRELGHNVHYAPYWGQCDPLELVPRALHFL